MLKHVENAGEPLRQSAAWISRLRLYGGLLLVLVLGFVLWTKRGALEMRYRVHRAAQERERATAALAVNSLEVAGLHARQAVEQAPWDVKSLEVFADVLMRARQRGASLILGRALELEPGDVGIALKWLAAARAEDASSQLDLRVPAILEQHRARPEVLRAVAALYRESKRPAEARPVYRELLAREPGDVDAAFELACIDLDLGASAERGAAVDTLEQLAKDPVYRTRAAWRLALALDGSDPRRAAEHLATVLKDQPNDVQATLQWLRVQHRLDAAGSPARIESQWQSTTNLALKVDLAVLMGSVDSPAAGLRMLDRLEAAERDRPSVMACRLALMGQTGDWGAVVEQVNAVLPAAIRDDRPQAEWEQALADWDREVRLARVTGATNESGMVPRDLLMLTWRVRAQRELKKPAEAMASLKMLATALEREPAFALAVVQMFREWRMPDAACDAVQHAATFDSPLRYSVLEAAQMDAMEAGREDVAREHLETMARLNPSDHVVSARLALLLLDAGEPAERACALATAAHVAAPRDAVITDICALALARAGRAAEAFKLLEQIPPNLSEQPLFRFTRARVLAAADRAGEARALAVTIPETAVPARSRAELERLKAGGTAAP